MVQGLEDILPTEGPVGELPPQAWMQAAATQTVLKALTARGTEVRFVGGCVRDSVLGRPIRDIDIATPDDPDVVMALLERAGIRAIPTGIEHGTVTAVIDKAHFEITTLRRDAETFGRQARVEYTDDWQEDADRRDFTINALSCRPDGKIFDYHHGLADLAAGMVRFIGDPKRRIDEDVLRLLRFFRFFAHYGRPPADILSLAACRAQAHRLPDLSGERVCGEILKLLAAPDPAVAMVMMQGERVLAEILPEAVDIGRLRMMCFLETRGLVHPAIRIDPLRRLAAVLGPNPEQAEQVAERLKMSNAEGERLSGLVSPTQCPDPSMSARQVRRLLHEVGADRYRDLLLMAWATRKAVNVRTPPGESDRWRAILLAADDWTPVTLPVRGKDVMDLGVSSGPQIGMLLAEVERWWVAGDFRASRSEALERLRHLVLNR